MSAGNLSVCLFGEKFGKIQTPRTGRNILSQMPFFNNNQLCFRKKVFQENFHHTLFRLGAVILPVLSYSLYNLLHQLIDRK
jgi:hypothetical protein